MRIFFCVNIFIKKVYSFQYQENSKNDKRKYVLAALDNTPVGGV